MHPKTKASPILHEYHNNNLREYKTFLKMLLAEERAQKKLREMYESCPPKDKKKKRRLKKKIKPRKKGRQRTKFDYEIAKEIVRAEGIMSGVQYDRWYKMNNPVRMPKNPERAYKSVWTGWGDFLGVYNRYTRRPGITTNGRGKYRSFEDARAFARSLNLKGYQDWKDYTKSGKCPMDIPHRPDVVYTSGKRNEYWLSWRDFLGSNQIQNTAEKIKEVMPVLYVAKKDLGAPNNVYIINVIPGGKPALIDHIQKMHVKLVCAYYTNHHFNHKEYLSTIPSYPYGGIDEFMLNNVYELIEYLDFNLERVSSLSRPLFYVLNICDRKLGDNNEQIGKLTI